MAEINPAARSAPPSVPAATKEKRKAKTPTNAEVNRISGLASGINTEQVVAGLMAVERKRFEPLQEQKALTQLELESFGVVQKMLDKIHASTKTLATRSIWEGKLVQSSDEDVVTATATAGAKPGKNTLVVDKLALNHQVASQGYEKADAAVGKGRFKLTVGEGNAITVTIDDSNDTLTGLKDAINFATKEVNATIIKTSNKDRPNQLVLTSQKTGSQGRIKLEVDLKGGEAPLFDNSVEPASPWRGVGDTKDTGKPSTGTGASTAIVRVVGDYAGKDDRQFTFTAVQSGSVGGDKPVQLRWKDNSGRNGLIQLDALNYAPGQPLEFVDGLSLLIGKGDVIVGDTFSFKARAGRTGLSWWLTPEQRLPAVTQPTSWSRQGAEPGKPIVEGPYTGSAEQNFTLTVQGSGQIGTSKNLRVTWQGSAGEAGLVNIGDGYTPGTKLAITDGITLTLNDGILTEGVTAKFSVTPQEQSAKWWLSDAERVIPAQMTPVTNWSRADKKAEAGEMPDLPPELGPRMSSSKVTVDGKYTGDDARVYTFTALRDGAIGTTKDLRIRWEDDKGNKGELGIGDDYETGKQLPFDSGLTIGFGAGRVFKDDVFTVRTRTATIQAPQDAVIRFGATELGGGLEITSSTNEMDNVIEGVKLSLVTANPKPVTITVKGETQKALDAVLEFVKQLNELTAAIVELSKYDKEKDEAGPLQANREIADIRNRIADLLIRPVAGLPKENNMLLALGIKLDENGIFKVEETQLRKKIEDNFAAVADIFREKGESNNTSVGVAGISDKTQVTATGYTVDVSQVATQGFYESPDLPNMIRVDRGANHFHIEVDGRRSDEIELEPRLYSLPDYARALQDKITSDKQIGQRGVKVLQEGRRVKFTSSQYGSRSVIALTPPPGVARAPQGLQGGQAMPGLDVAGTIAGQPAEGSAQMLKAKDDSKNPAAGLRLIVRLTEAQLNKGGPEAKITVSRGVAARLSAYLGMLTDKQRGEMKRITDGLRGRITNVDQQLNRMEERLESKRQRIQEKFAELETKMSKLRGQQNSMASQLGAGGGGGPASATRMKGR
jgi:flagellar capping protein FliD